MNSAQQEAVMESIEELVIRCRQRRTAQKNYLEYAHAEEVIADELDRRIAALRELLR